MPSVTGKVQAGCRVRCFSISTRQMRHAPSGGRPDGGRAPGCRSPLAVAASRTVWPACASILRPLIVILQTGHRVYWPPFSFCIRLERSQAWGRGIPMMSSHSRSQRRQRLASSRAVASSRPELHFAEIAAALCDRAIRAPRAAVRWRSRPGCSPLRNVRTSRFVARLGAARRSAATDRPPRPPGCPAPPPGSPSPGRSPRRRPRRRPAAGGVESVLSTTKVLPRGWPRCRSLCSARRDRSSGRWPG